MVGRPERSKLYLKRITPRIKRKRPLPHRPFRLPRPNRLERMVSMLTQGTLISRVLRPTAGIFRGDDERGLAAAAAHGGVLLNRLRLSCSPSRPPPRVGEGKRGGAPDCGARWCWLKVPLPTSPTRGGGEKRRCTRLRGAQVLVEAPPPGLPHPWGRRKGASPVG